MGKLLLTQTPPLRAPYLVAGFAGWPNGGSVSTDVIDFLRSYLGAERIGEITADELYIYSSPTLASRPTVVIRQGLVQALRFPSNELFAWQRPDAAHDLLLLQGVEPDLYWHRYAAAVLECMRRFGVRRLYTIGGYLDYAPHTRAPRISAVVTHAALRRELAAYAVELTDYEGPTSIQSYLLSLCQQQGIEGISLWGSAPSYIQGAYPKVTQAVLRLLGQMWQLPLELGALQEQAEELEETLHEQIDSNPELADYIKRLEQAYDQAEEEEEAPEPDTMMEEIQQFLRRRRRRQPPPDSDPS
ncbi:MAG: proteasome assembly chaperone family protein [Candidatus Tectimicrobiota bacterium]|nr:MAG: proteasome assembly chaperone family protein [Candidatus Tectomicrobia bacterium]